MRHGQRTAHRPFDRECMTQVWHRADLVFDLAFFGLAGLAEHMRRDDSFYDDLAQEFYGLDSKTLAVDSVSITKSGKMHRWTMNDGYISAQLTGPNMQAEVTQHFGLVYLVAVQPDASVELRRQIMRGLTATARLLKGR